MYQYTIVIRVMCTYLTIALGGDSGISTGQRRCYGYYVIYYVRYTPHTTLCHICLHELVDYHIHVNYTRMCSLYNTFYIIISHIYIIQFIYIYKLYLKYSYFIFPNNLMN